MKRFLALFLVLVLAFSVVLVSCKGKGDENPEETTDEEEDFVGIGGTTAGSDTSSTTAPTGITHTDFTWTDDTAGAMVYIRIDKLNVRTDTFVDDSTYKGTAKFGESYKRIRYNDSWTQIEFGGGQYYVSTEFVTTDPGSVLFTDDAEPSTVYVDVDTTLFLRTSTFTRTSSLYEGNIAFSVRRGVALTRIGVSQNGNWVKVKYEGDDRVLYCNTAYVSTTQPGTETTGSSANTPAEG